jgi:hypothetical protein
MGFLSRLFSGKSDPTKEEPLSVDAARGIVADFGETLERATVGPTQVSDTALLPHTKERIDAAFSVLFAAGVPDEWRGSVSTAYLSLAWFQPGAGAGPLGLRISPAELASLSDEELARRVTEQSKAGSAAVGTASAEFDRRTEEISRLGW